MAKDQEYIPKPEKEKKAKKAAGSAAKKAGMAMNEEDEKLFAKLRKLRAEIAKKEGVPPYIVFSDKTLVHMSIIQPADSVEMLTVSGVGEHKLQKYGEQFLHCVADFRREHVDKMDFDSPEFQELGYDDFEF